jgi:hypothetical protein
VSAIPTLAAAVLVLYERARAALVEARSVDEVKDIRDKAVAMQVYAKQARDRSLIEDATEIRMRAERRAGELLAEMDKNKGARGAGPGRGKKAVAARDRLLDTTPKLSDLGVSKTQSSRWQRFAALDDETFETRVIAEKKRHSAVSTLYTARSSSGPSARPTKSASSKAAPSTICAPWPRADIRRVASMSTCPRAI